VRLPIWILPSPTRLWIGKVAARVIIRGTHLGELPSIAPTGKRAAVMGQEIWRVAGTRITEHWGRFEELDRSNNSASSRREDLCPRATEASTASPGGLEDRKNRHGRRPRQPGRAQTMACASLISSNGRDTVGRSLGTGTPRLHQGDTNAAVFGSAGGGYARYSESKERANGSPNPSQRDTNTGALRLGGGVDARALRWLATTCTTSWSRVDSCFVSESADALDRGGRKVLIDKRR
jgi:hypothetical protein